MKKLYSQRSHINMMILSEDDNFSNNVFEILSESDRLPFSVAAKTSDKFISMSEPPDILLCDYGCNSLYAIDIMRKCRKLYEFATIIIVGSKMSDTLKQLRNRYFDLYINKNDFQNEFLPSITSAYVCSRQKE